MTKSFQQKIFDYKTNILTALIGAIVGTLVTLLVTIATGLKEIGLNEARNEIEAKVATKYENLSSKLERMKEQIETIENSDLYNSLKNMKGIPSGGIVLISNREQCPAGGKQFSTLSIQVATKDNVQHRAAKAITKETTWDVSSKYDGRLFKACIF